MDRCPACAGPLPPASRFCPSCAAPTPPPAGPTTPLPEEDSSPPPTPLVPGELFLGKYRIVRLLGQGAMGVVYEALDTFIERRVAIKTIRLGATALPERDAALSRRLAREARAAGQLNHPNIVTTHDAGVAGAISYLVMEYVDGTTLAAEIARAGPLPHPRAVEIARQIALALGHAHQHGVLHRDIKPSNVLLAGDGAVKVTDFGIARLVADASTLTTTGAVMGTPAYLSPEQVRGGELDGRADLFSLATLFYECLSGRRPFAGDTLPVLMFQILETEPPAIELGNPVFDAELADFFRQALAKDRDDRFPDAAAVLAALERLQELEGSTVPPRGAGRVAPARRGTPASKPPPYGRLVALATILVAVGTIPFYLARRPPSPVTAGPALLSVGSLAPATSAPADGEGPATPLPGRLRLAVTPQAHVRVDDGPEDFTTLLVTDLPPGRHRLHLRQTGYQPLWQDFIVSPDQPLELSLTLTALARGSAQLVLAGSPWAYFRIDDGGEMELPHGPITLLEGTHSVEVYRQGYRTVRRSFEVVSGQEARVTVELARP